MFKRDGVSFILEKIKAILITYAKENVRIHISVD